MLLGFKAVFHSGFQGAKGKKSVPSVAQDLCWVQRQTIQWHFILAPLYMTCQMIHSSASATTDWLTVQLRGKYVSCSLRFGAKRGNSDSRFSSFFPFYCIKCGHPSSFTTFFRLVKITHVAHEMMEPTTQSVCQVKLLRFQRTKNLFVCWNELFL